MRIVGQIPHPQLSITLFLWNGKYIVKFEAGGYEQSYKIPENAVKGIEDLKARVDSDFIEKVYDRFEKMHLDFLEIIQKKNSTNN